jgi:type I restriction enzyme S subunit
MNLETFFEKFELFADAPNAVAKMRDLVLLLAVQGKLVEQRTTELSARECIRRANKPLVDVAPDELVETRAGWVALPLGCVIASNTGGGTPSKQNPSYWNGSIPWASVKDVQSEKYLVSTIDAISEEGLKNSSSNLIPPNRLIVVTRMGLGKLAINTIPVAINQDLRAVEPTTALDLDYAYLLFKSLKMVGSGVTVKGITVDKLHAMPALLPPFAEQKRIVAKVDELMALCDQLEAQQKEHDTRQAALASASLSRFAAAPTPENLNYIFHKSYDITPAELRKTILTLAVQGKLVPQDPHDEPAEELFARLEQERARIAKDQGVRPPKNVPPLAADNYPHDIPESWQWSRIGHLALVIDYGTSQKADSDSSKVPVYRMGNIVGGRLVDENLKYVDASIDDLPGLYLKTGDILFNRTNSYELVGKAGIYTGPDDKATFASYLIRIRLPDALLFPPFYSLAMNAPYYRQTQIEPEVVQQCGQANFNGTKLASTVVPLPPLAEQRRIVAKVEQLMKLVDELEAQIAMSRDSGAKLLDAVVHEFTSR